MAETQRLSKITIKASDSAGYWAGMTAQNLKNLYRQLYSLGTLSQAHYIVELNPYDPTGPLSKVELFDRVPLRRDDLDLVSYVPRANGSNDS